MLGQRVAKESGVRRAASGTRRLSPVICASAVPSFSPRPVAAALLSAALLLCPPSDVPAAFATDKVAGFVQGPARVVDGDTLAIGSSRIRLYGIDAPESKQSCNNESGKEYACGLKSKEVLAAKIGKQIVTCNVRNTDQYGRNVSVCKLGGEGGEDLNAWLVANGYAVAYRQYGKDYIPLEEAAHAKRLGIWAGDFTTPSVWRKQQKSNGAAGASGSSMGSMGSMGSMDNGGSMMPVSAPPPAVSPKAPTGPQPGQPSCPTGIPPIKGNIGSKGDKIYHVPGSRYYDQVKIDVSAGEKWFCSDAEAVAAGFRAAGSK